MKMPAVLTSFFEAQAAYLTATDPKQQRADLKRRINLAVGNPAAQDWWVAGCAADMVVTGALDIKRLLDRLATVERRRKLPPDDPNHIGSPQPWLQRAMAKLANQRGVPFGKRATEMAQ